MITLKTSPTTELEQDGFTLLKEILNFQKDTQPVIDEIGEILDWIITRLHLNREFAHRYEGMSVTDRLIAFISDTGDKHFQYLAIHLFFGNYPANMPMYLGPAMFNLMRSPRLLNTIEQFIGPVWISSKSSSVHPHQATRTVIAERRTRTSKWYDFKYQIAPRSLGI